MDKGSNKLLKLNAATMHCLWPDRYDSTENYYIYLKNYALKLYLMLM